MDTNHVFVLGAGFSRAISGAMPLTDELGQQANERVGSGAYGQIGRRLPLSRSLTFEGWLSLLSEAQPQLSDADNRENSALFARLRDAIADVLSEAELEGSKHPAPKWLYELVRVLHVVRATVITFNYDCLIETAVASHTIWDPRHRELVTPRDVLQDLPPLPAVGVRLFGPLNDTFRLLKLHGSRDWWAVPEDLSGATLNREDTHGTFGDPQEMTDERRRRELPGRERFIIPPLSAKGSYYRNPLTRELWQQADQALREASRVSIVGYSLPPADLVVANLLRSAVAKPDVTVDVVNPDPTGIAERLVGLGASEDKLSMVDGRDCVRTFTCSLCDETSATLVGDLKASLLPNAQDAALAVAWGSTDSMASTSRVAGVRDRGDGTIELRLEPGTPRHGATGPRFDDDPVPEGGFPCAADLAARLADHRRIVAADHAGDHTVVAAWEEGRTVGASARWIFFAPADSPSEGLTVAT